MEGGDRRLVLSPVPEPSRAEWETNAGRRIKPDAKDYARTRGISLTFDLSTVGEQGTDGNELQTLHYAEDLERYCRKLQREMKSALEETGAHVLFLVLGFLEFPEPAPSEQKLTAPLIAVPVTIEKGALNRETRSYRYHIAYAGDEVAENLSLKEKLRQDHSFELPDFDDEVTTPEEYFRKLQEAIRGKEGWKLRQQMTLTLLSFTKMLLVRDIDPSKWPTSDTGQSGLTEHPIVRMVFEGVGHQDGVDMGLGRDEVYDVDNHPRANFPLIYDADSSQHSALIDALSGRNMVIEGPPGTGKSQTITNLIAAAIAEGKSVLFLSEKMAALEVVKKRLTFAGLGDFCLELHSNKTQKKQVLEAIESRKNKRFPFPQTLMSQLNALEEKRLRLKAYADLINSVVGNSQGLTMYSVLWKAERYRQGSGNTWRTALDLVVPNAHELTDVEFQSLRNTLTYTCQQYRKIRAFSQVHPFWGFSPTELMPGVELRVERLLRNMIPQFEEFQKLFDEATAFIGGRSLILSRDKSAEMMTTLSAITPAHAYLRMSVAALPRLFSPADPNGDVGEATIRQFDERLQRVRDLRIDVEGRLNRPETLTGADEEVAQTLKMSLSELGLTGASCDSVRVLGNEVLHVAAAVSRALSTIEECGRIVRVGFDGSEVQLKKICALIDVAKLAPRDLLQYRHEGLKRPNAVTVIEKAHEALQRIQRNREILSDVLYLDMIPPEDELTEAILVLREGDAWYRMFQNRWRQACRLHRILDKTKVKINSAQRLEDLDRLLTFIKVTKNWSANLVYRDALGPLYQGEDTSFENAAKLMTWLTTTQRKLAEVGLAESEFNPLEVTEARLLEMVACSSRLHEAIAALTKGKELLRERSSSLHLPLENVGETMDWSRLLSHLNQLGSLIKVAADKLLVWSPGHVSVAESLKAVTSGIALPQAVQSVDQDRVVKVLLGDQFRSIETDTGPVWDALTFGRRVLGLNLHSEITKALLSDEVESNFKMITGYVKAIQAGWESVDSFAAGMVAYGRFDLERWAGTITADASFLDGLIRRNKHAAASTDELLPWVQYLQQSERARERGLGDFISLLESGSVESDHLPNLFGYRFYSSIASHVFRDCLPLRQFSGEIHKVIREEFASLDREIIKLRGRECAHRAAQNWVSPQGTNGVRLDDKTELSLLQYLFPQARPRMAIRKMMQRAGRAIQAFKPCFMMGPHALAQFIEPGTVNFDIVVMDEASQLKPEVAIGAVARGRQLVVVGDPKQLPPTGFFDRLSRMEDDDEDAAAALTSQSILDVCIGHFKPVRTLRWHYRSKHESLIAFSNHHFYKNLIIFPSPYPKTTRLGVRYRYIHDGIYQDQVNPVEATHITDAVIDHMLNHPDSSLGVITLNHKQRDLILDLLEQRYSNHPQTEKYRNHWKREGMEFIVKNLENIQGDERDVIFISATFGKPPGASVVRQTFGPITGPAGWRRLNVLFTRARNAIHVFTSMSPEDVIVGPDTPQGTKTLRDYLEYARSGILVDITPTGGEAESDFEIAVAEVLRHAGFQVEPQLGVAGFRIDIAVKHPELPFRISGRH